MEKRKKLRQGEEKKKKEGEVWGGRKVEVKYMEQEEEEEESGEVPMEVCILG